MITDATYSSMTVREREELWRLQTDGMIDASGWHVWQTPEASEYLRQFERQMNKKYETSTVPVLPA